MTKTGKWLPESPIRRNARCDRCNLTVQADSPRYMVFDKQGPDRVNGKKSKSSYLCALCAWKEYKTHPPVEKQEAWDFG